MFQLLNRITWVVSIIFWITIVAIEEDLLIFWIIGIFLLKYLVFSPNYIRERLRFFQTQLLKGYKPENWQTLSLSQENHQEVKQENTEKLSSQEAFHISENWALQNLALSSENTKVKNERVEIHEQKIQSINQEKQSSEPGIFQKFFAENLLAKLGWILVFLGVLFFLSLIYTIVGPVAKMLIGFLLAAGVYLTGVWLDKKWFQNESRIVMGTAILINYLVILSGRYLLDWGNVICQDTGIVRNADGSLGGICSSGKLLSVWVMFFFLILNTLLAVMTSLLYTSRTLLIFSFVFAYLNPFLLGEPSSEPYTLLGYTMIVTLGAMYLAWKQKDEVLFPLSFILAALMFLLAPWSDANGWIAKLLCVNMLGVISIFVITRLQEKYENAYQILITSIFFLIACMWFLWYAKDFSLIQYSILWISSLWMMLWCYAKSSSEKYIYSISTLAFIITLSPAIFSFGTSGWSFALLSLWLIWTFALANIFYPLAFLRTVTEKNIGNITAGLTSWALFLTYMIYLFWNMYFPWMLQGMVFFALACVYAGLSYTLVWVVWMKSLQTENKYSYLFYTIAALATSLFSLSIAFIFANNPEIICIVWLLEASVLFFMAQKIHSHKIALWALAIFAVWIGKLFLFFAWASLWLIFSWLSSYTAQWNYGLAVTLCIVLASFIANLFSLFPKNADVKKLDEWVYALHHILHIVGGIILWALFLIVFKVDSSLEVLLVSVLYATLIWYIYTYFKSEWLMLVQKISCIALMGIHILMFFDEYTLSWATYTYSTLAFIALALPYIHEYIKKKSISFSPYFIIFLLYAFVLSSLYVYKITNLTFAVTLYWGTLAFLVFSRGISKDILPLRTIWLYLISLTSIKVFFYDVWYNVDNLVSRVVVLIVLWILMIILSTMYTRKFGNTLGKDFSPDNLFWKKQKEWKF